MLSKIHWSQVGATAVILSVLGQTSYAADDQDAVGRAEKVLAAGYQGLVQNPPLEGPEAIKGKKVWYISCGQSFVFCSELAKGFAEAATHLDWTVSIQDGRATPSVASDLIKQAVAARADAIAVSSFDCPGIKSALLLAKAQGVPVISAQSSDCDYSAFGGGEKLFTASTKLYGSSEATDFYRRLGELRASYIIAKTKGQAKVVAIEETSQQITQASHKAFMERMAECTKCTVFESKFNFSQVPSPATQIWQSALLQNPDANVISNGIDALMDLGLRVAVRQYARADQIIGGGEGFPNNFDMIRNGGQTYSVGIPFTWIGWAMADTTNRILAGQKPSELPNEGTGFMFVDREHNLPEAGKMLEFPLDFRSAYTRVWNR